MKKILIFLENDYEDLELWFPKIRLEEAGHQVIVAAPVADKVYEGKNGYPCKAEKSFDSIDSKNFDALLIPGGYAPDKLRRHKKVLDITSEMNKAGKIIAFICHAGWVPISAKILKGRKATSVSAIKDDMENAGVIWSDEALVIDGNLISSRSPADLYLFGKAIVDALSKKK